jgi:hypothetical protein
LTIFILDWDGVLLAGDDVAVPALGQSNFLLFDFGLFFIFSFLYLVVGISRFKVSDASGDMVFKIKLAQVSE